MVITCSRLNADQSRKMKSVLIFVIRMPTKRKEIVSAQATVNANLLPFSKETKFKDA